MPRCLDSSKWNSGVTTLLFQMDMFGTRLNLCRRYPLDEVEENVCSVWQGAHLGPNGDGDVAGV